MRDQVAILGREFVLLGCGGSGHAITQGSRQFRLLAFQKQANVVYRFLVALGRGQILHARTEAASDVELQARPRVIAVQINVARRHKEVAVNQICDAVGEVGREVRAVVFAAVFFQPPCDIHARKALAKRELDVRISFVVAQKDVVARLLLLDEVVLERQRFLVVVDDDVVDVDGLAHERAGLGVGQGFVREIVTDAGAQILGLADINDLAFGVLVQVHAGRGGKGPNFSEQVHVSVSGGSGLAKPHSRAVCVVIQYCR